MAFKTTITGLTLLIAEKIPPGADKSISLLRSDNSSIYALVYESHVFLLTKELFC